MLTEQIFSKNFFEITLDDLKVFFSEEQDENATLEFKEGGVTLEKVYREVCAFLNTEGGVLIIGSPREIEDPLLKRKYCKGELTPSIFRNAEWLIQKIAGNISPAPANIKIRDFFM